MTDRAFCSWSGKLSYDSRADANASRIGITTSRRVRGGSKRAVGDLQTFKCGVCGHWHLGRPRTVNNFKPRKGE